MILIADAGSTKTDWAMILPGGETKIVNAPGLNPALLDVAAVESRLLETLPRILNGATPSAVYYYGAGCIPSTIPGVAIALQSTTGCSEVHVASDLLGAARSLCGHHPGIACILGTGSNSCAYDGREITDATPALGFILGDEGSGASIGRRFLSDLFKRQLRPEIMDSFTARFGLTMADVIDRVYRQPSPNRFLASMMPFIGSHISDPQISNLVTDELRRFLLRNVANYPDAHTLPINFTGSIALHFRPQLESALADCQMHLGQISPSPITGLIRYHYPNHHLEI